MNIFQKRTVGKKGIAAALLASQLLFTAGCGSGEQRETAGQLDTEQTMQQDGYIVVGYVQVGSESDWRTTNTQSFKDVFTQENGYYLIFEDGQQKQENQIKAIRSFIASDVDVISFCPIVETGEDGVTYDILYDILIKQNGDIHSDWTGVKMDVDAYRKVVFEPYDLRVLDGVVDF